MSDIWHDLNGRYVQGRLLIHYSDKLAHRMTTALQSQYGIGKVHMLSDLNRLVFKDTEEQVIKFGRVRDFNPIQPNYKYSHQTAVEVNEMILKPITIIDFIEDKTVISLEIFNRIVPLYSERIPEDIGIQSLKTLEQSMLEKGYKMKDLFTRNAGCIELSKEAAETLPESRKFLLKNGQILLAHNSIPVAFCIDSELLRRRTDTIDTKLLPNDYSHHQEHNNHNSPDDIYYHGIQEEFIEQLRKKIPLTNTSQRQDIVHHYVVASGGNWQTYINDERTSDLNKGALFK